MLDGNGIEPDLLVDRGAAGELEKALDRRAAFFFFANQYAATHASLSSDFVVTDAVLNEFRDWLDAQRFSYRTDAERGVDSLLAGLADIGYSDAIDEAESLRDAIRNEKTEDFERYEDRLKDRLYREIIARYYGETAQIRAALARDPEIREAARVLNDPTSYAALLSRGG